MNRLNELMPSWNNDVLGNKGKLAYLCKGGTPKAAPPTPPVTEKRSEVTSAARRTKIDARKRKGQQSTLLAGETGTAEATRKTLLG